MCTPNQRFQTVTFNSPQHERGYVWQGLCTRGAYARECTPASPADVPLQDHARSRDLRQDGQPAGGSECGVRRAGVLAGGEGGPALERGAAAAWAQGQGPGGGQGA